MSRFSTYWPEYKKLFSFDTHSSTHKTSLSNFIRIDLTEGKHRSLKVHLYKVSKLINSSGDSLLVHNIQRSIAYIKKHLCLQSKGDHQQNENATYWMAKDICKSCL